MKLPLLPILITFLYTSVVAQQDSIRGGADFESGNSYFED